MENLIEIISKIFKYFLFIIPSVPGFGCAIAGIVYKIKHKKTYKESELMEGTVVDIEVSQNNSMISNEEDTFETLYIPIVEYTTEDGSVKRTTLPAVKYKSLYQINQKVSVPPYGGEDQNALDETHALMLNVFIGLGFLFGIFGIILSVVLFKFGG